MFLLSFPCYISSLLFLKTHFSEVPFVRVCGWEVLPFFSAWQCPGFTSHFLKVVLPGRARQGDGDFPPAPWRPTTVSLRDSHQRSSWPSRAEICLLSSSELSCFCGVASLHQSGPSGVLLHIFFLFHIFGVCGVSWISGLLSFNISGQFSAVPSSSIA